MKKYIVIQIFAIFFIFNLIAQTNITVDLGDPIYKIIDSLETRGIIDGLPNNKPYTNNVILNVIDNVLDNPEKITENELEIINSYRDFYSSKSETTRKNTFLHCYANNNNDDFPLSFKYNFSNTLNIAGALYSNKNDSNYSFDFLNEIDLQGEISKYISYKWIGKLDITYSPLKYLGEYDCGYYWYNKDESKNNLRTVKKYSNNTYLPYTYDRLWDGQIYYLKHLDADGLEGWPVSPSIGLNVLGDIRSSFWDNNITLGFGRIKREIAAMDDGSSLVLNSMARPFTAVDLQANILKFIRFTFLVGSLEYPNQDYMNKNWWPDQSEVVDDAKFFQNNFTLNMLDFDFKYFHFDLGTSVVWPNRLAIGYLFPVTNYVEYQNHIGDGDNLGIFGDIKLKYPKLGEFWISGYVDEINPRNNYFVDTRVMFALQTGMKYAIPKLPFATLSFRYTKVEPYCYTHQSINYTPWYNHYINQNYTSGGYCLGYYLDPNSDEFKLSFDLKPDYKNTINVSYSLIRHGADYGSQQVPGSSLYSELNPEDRDDLHKYFLHDGAYNWQHIVNLGGKYNLLHKFPISINYNIGFLFSYFTAIDTSNYSRDGKTKNCNFETPYFIINNEEYSTNFGVILSLGVRVEY